MEEFASQATWSWNFSLKDGFVYYGSMYYLYTIKIIHSIYLCINTGTHILSCLLQGVSIYHVETGLGHQEGQAWDSGQGLEQHSSHIFSSSESLSSALKALELVGSGSPTLSRIIFLI